MSRYLLLSLTLTLYCLSQLGCQTNQYEPPPPPTVTVARPVEQEITNVQEYTGSTRAVETVDVRARVKGFLEKSHFEEGAAVEAGTLLYTIDPKPFEAKLNEMKAAWSLAKAGLKLAHAEVAKTKAQVANAEGQYQRGLKAAQGGAVTQSEIDNLRTRRDSAAANYHAAGASVASAEAQIDAAWAAVEQAELDLGYTKVASPIAGRVGRDLVDQGNLVGSGEPTLLNTIVSYDPIYAYFSISEVDLLHSMRSIREEGGNDEEETRLKWRKQPVHIALADETGYPHKGLFDFADLAIDEGTGTFLVRAIFTNPEHVIPPGAFVRIQIPTDKRMALLVPDTAVGRDQGGTYVLVVNSEKVVERRNLKLGVVVDGMQVVHAGLQADEWVVVKGIQRARPGTKVQTEQAEGSPPGTVPAEKNETAADIETTKNTSSD